MKAKHTKGNWILKDATILNPNHDSKIGNIKEVAQCYTGFNEKETTEECMANAKLIASAPALLKVLVALKIKYLFNQTKTQAKNNHIDETLLEVEEAIKKATE